MWERGAALPSTKNMQEAAMVLKKSYDWLATGRGKDNNTSVEGLRLWGEVAAGVWTEVIERQEAEFDCVPVAPDSRYPVNAQYALKIKGNSVNRVAKDGTIIVCVDIAEAGVQVRPGDLVWVERHRGSLVEATVKRIRQGREGLELWPESDDPSHQEKLSLKPRKGDTTIAVRGLVIRVVTDIPRGE